MSRERRFFGEAIIRIAHDEPREGCFLSDTVTRISKAPTDAQATIQTMHLAFNGCAYHPEHRRTREADGTQLAQPRWRHLAGAGLNRWIRQGAAPLLNRMPKSAEQRFLIVAPD